MGGGNIRGGGTIGWTVRDNRSSVFCDERWGYKERGNYRVDTRTIGVPFSVMRGGDLRGLLTGSTLGSSGRSVSVMRVVRGRSNVLVFNV